jgi:hypothetical protein
VICDLYSFKWHEWELRHAGAADSDLPRDCHEEHWISDTVLRGSCLSIGAPITAVIKRVLSLWLATS